MQASLSTESLPRSAPSTATPVPAAVGGFVPRAPESLEAAGLSTVFVEEHLLRALHAAPQTSGAQLAAACGIRFQSGVSAVLDTLRQDHQVEIRGQRGIGEAGYAYALTSKGTARAVDALERTQYRGPLPVPIDDYIESVVAQRIKSELVTQASVRQAFSDLLVPDALSDRIGPSIMSGSALFLFGSPGNGKTAMAERISRVLGDPMYIPHALEVDGTIVKLFDPLVHRAISGESAPPGVDQRWVQIERPLVTAGGELTMAGLDLLWSQSGRYYEAPLQLKANGGVLLIDDFGRQQVRPTEMLNRWIVPLEKQVDYLTLLTGKRVRVPFQQMLVFATNLEPADSDEAFLRRIRFKLRLDDPTLGQFSELFRRECAARGVGFSVDALATMLQRWWPNRPLRMCQPRDIVEQMASIARYRGLAAEMRTPGLVDLACASYFAVTIPD
jgi:predicted ATPase with chaperone activity